MGDPLCHYHPRCAIRRAYSLMQGAKATFRGVLLLLKSVGLFLGRPESDPECEASEASQDS